MKPGNVVHYEEDEEDVEEENTYSGPCLIQISSETSKQLDFKTDVFFTGIFAPDGQPIYKHPETIKCGFHTN